MSLCLRLISLVVIVLAVSLLFGGAIACFSASRSVRTEMLSALVVAQQTIEKRDRRVADISGIQDVTAED